MTEPRPRVTPQMADNAIKELRARGFAVMPYGQSRHLLNEVLILSSRELCALAKFAWQKEVTARKRKSRIVSDPKPRRAALIEFAKQHQQQAANL